MDLLTCRHMNFGSHTLSSPLRAIRARQSRLSYKRALIIRFNSHCVLANAEADLCCLHKIYPISFASEQSQEHVQTGKKFMKGKVGLIRVDDVVHCLSRRWNRPRSPRTDCAMARRGAVTRQLRDLLIASISRRRLSCDFLRASISRSRPSCGGSYGSATGRGACPNLQNHLPILQVTR